MNERPTCATCLAFCPDECERGTGECRRHAPRRHPGTLAPWAIVRKDDWCIEYVPQLDPEKVGHLG